MLGIAEKNQTAQNAPGPRPWYPATPEPGCTDATTGLPAAPGEGTNWGKGDT